MSNPRPKWPQEEFELWNAPRHFNIDFDERMSNDEDGLEAGQLFIREIVDYVEARVEAFINDQCSARGVGSPDLRRLARVNLAHAIEKHGLMMMVTSAAICREHGLPWAALAEVAESRSVTTFQRRWEDTINAEITKRDRDRDQYGPLLGDQNYGGPATSGHTT